MPTNTKETTIKDLTNLLDFTIKAYERHLITTEEARTLIEKIKEQL